MSRRGRRSGSKAGGSGHLRLVVSAAQPLAAEVSSETNVSSVSRVGEGAQEGDQEEGQERGRTPAESLQDAIMFAACAWCAVAREETPAQVSIAPVGGGVYEVSIAMASGAPGAVLRMEFMLRAGLELRVVAGPVRPG
jgi:hypothetical protein